MIGASLSAPGELFRRLPTSDLYVLNPLRLLRRISGGDVPGVRNLGGNAYQIGRTGVIVRYGSAHDIDAVRRAGARQIVYVADDDFAAGAADASLPAPYRARLAAFIEDAWPDLVSAADTVIVSSPVLAAPYGAKARVLAPAWDRPPGDTDHFEKPGLAIAHFGTASHRADLAAIAPAIADLLRDRADARLTLIGEAPPPLQHHPQVRATPPMRWWRYRRRLPRQRFHLALLPMRDTAFNRARSANKLYEHAIVGAASLLSPSPALRDAAGPDAGALLVERWEDWPNRLAEALADREALRRRAEATRARILTADPLRAAADFWRDLLSRAG